MTRLRRWWLEWTGRRRARRHVAAFAGTGFAPVYAGRAPAAARGAWLAECQREGNADALLTATGATEAEAVAALVARAIRCGARP